MRLDPTRVDGAWVVGLEPHEDERGFFARLWDPAVLAAAGLSPELAQVSLSRTTRAGTVRGLHYQRPPHEEAKLVRCVRGSLFDVVVDLRPGSPTYRAWDGVVLDAREGAALYVPEGCAHGFQTLEDDVDVLYLISAAYAPDAATGVRFDDPAFGVAWPRPVTVVSDRDRSWPRV